MLDKYSCPQIRTEIYSFHHSYNNGIIKLSPAKYQELILLAWYNLYTRMDE